MPQGNLSGVTDEDIEPDCGNRQYPNSVNDIQKVRTQNKRRYSEKKQQKNAQADPSKPCLKNGQFLVVIFMIVATGMKG